jgi:UDP-glucose 4-epimerase
MESPTAIGEVFNIGSQSEISILGLASTIKKFHNSSSEIKLIPYNQAYDSGFEDMERRRPNINKIKNQIGWAPTIDLNRIISDMTNYFLSEKSG